MWAGYQHTKMCMYCNTMTIVCLVLHVECEYVSRARGIANAPLGTDSGEPEPLLTPSE